MEGAPQGSLQQKMDVRKEDDQIVGPLPKEEIERMYTNSMINVDSVSEKVCLVFQRCWFEDCYLQAFLRWT